MEKVTSYFEISKEAEMAYDLDTGESSPAYVHVSSEHIDGLTDEQRQKIRQGHKLILSQEIEIPEDLIREITKEEHDSNTEGE